MKLKVAINRAEALRRGYPTSSDALDLEISADELGSLPDESRKLLATRLHGDGTIVHRRKNGCYVGIGRREKGCFPVSAYECTDHSGRNDQDWRRVQVSEPTLAGVLEAIRAEEAAIEEHRAAAEQEAAAKRADCLRRSIEILREHRWYRLGPSWPEDATTEIREAALAEVSGAADWIAGEQERILRETEAHDRTKKIERAAEEAAERADSEERRHWIEEHGSERLRRCAGEGIEYMAVYRDERLALDRPGWHWSDDVGGEIDDPRNPPAEAFATLDAARKLDPAAQLRRYTVKHEHGKDCYDVGEDDCPRYDVSGYVAEAEFLGRKIIFGDALE